MIDAYRLAQHAVVDLKAAVLTLLEQAGDRGLRNVDIGKTLGIYSGHVGHEGHIPRTLLEMLAHEGIARQDKESQLWYHVRHGGQIPSR
jgi:hypothetical protein